MKTYFLLLLLTLAGMVSRTFGEAYEYDDAGRLTKLLHPGGKAVTYTFDVSDNLTQLQPSTVPAAVTGVSISAGATLTWKFTGSGSGFLIQRSLARSDEWTDGETLAISARSAFIANPGAGDWFIRIVVLGTPASVRSAPSSVVRYPSGIKLIVTTAADENDHQLGAGTGNSLREILEAAFAGDQIHFAPVLSGATIELNGTALRVEKNVTIDARPLPDRINISARNLSRVFNLSSDGAVLLGGLRIIFGNASLGGGINNAGAALTLSNCNVSHNYSTDNGGGVYLQAGGSLVVDEGTSVLFNTATLGGGGVYLQAGGSLTVNGALFGGNFADEGGAIHNLGSSPSIGYASFIGNGATTGGAIFNKDSTGGVIFNCTFGGNGSIADAGGGVANRGTASLILRHCTIAANNGAGVSNVAPATLTLDNSIVANNNNAVTNTARDLTGNYTAVGANLVQNHTGTVVSGPAALTGDAALGEFNFGVLEPQSGSQAIDNGVMTVNTPSSDQNRDFRPFGPAPDLGAVESRLSANADLLWLTTSAGKLTPGFDPDVTDYTASVPGTTTTAAVKASKAANGQTLEVRANGGAFTELSNETASDNLPLNAGANTIEFKVTSATGTTSQTYRIIVTRGTPAAPTGLAALTASAGVISPAFDPAVIAYRVIVPNGTPTTTVTAPPTTGTSTVAVRLNFGDFVPVASGQPSPALALHVGDNTIEVQVTNAAGAVTKLYTLIASREAPANSNANLSAMTTNAGALSPAFSPAVIYYRATVKNNVVTATVTPAKVAATATIQVRANGGVFGTVASGSPSPAKNLRPGENFFEIKVTAQDGAIRIYSLIITRVVSGMEWASSPDFGSESAMSADCRYVAYVSGNDIHIYDRVQHTTEIVSKSNSGDSANRESKKPSISADGRYVAFQSRADNLVPNDDNGQNDPSRGEDIFVYDRTTDTIQRVSVSETGGQSNQASKSASISGDGRYVSFMSGANNLVSNYTLGSNTALYVVDRTTVGTGAVNIFGISVPLTVQGNREVINSVISADGYSIAFEYNVNTSNFPQFNYTDIYVLNRTTRAIERITGNKVGGPANGLHSQKPSISSDGRYVAFQSNLPDLDFFDVNGQVDVFIHDRVEGTTQRVSSSYTGVDEFFPDSTNAAISGNGRYVAFQSGITNFVPNDTAGFTDVFVRDMLTGRMNRASVSPNGAEGNGDSSQPSLSFDGQCVSFTSSATNLLAAGSTSGGVFVSFIEPAAVSALTDLAALTSNLGPIAPVLRPGLTSYSVSVPASLTTARFLPVPAEPRATLQVRINAGVFASLDAGEIAALPLDLGANAIQIEVTAPDGTTKQTYDLAVVRGSTDPAFSNPNLANLTTNAGALTPVFAADVALFTMQVPTATTSMTVTPTVAVAGATVTVNGTAVASGAASAAITVAAGSTTITIIVTAPDGFTTKTSAIAVTRAPNPNANLASLVLSTGTLVPAFAAATTTYTVSVPNATSTMTVTAAVAQSEATLTLNGEPLAPGTPSNPISLAVGSNTISIVVLAATTKTYTVTVTRAAPVNTANYTVVTSSGTMTVTDTSGNGDTLVISRAVAGTIRFTATGRTFSVNSSGNTNDNSGDVPLFGITAIVVNAAGGNDTINVNSFTGPLGSLTFNGDAGTDTINFNGSLTSTAIAATAEAINVAGGITTSGNLTLTAANGVTVTGIANSGAGTLAINSDSDASGTGTTTVSAGAGLFGATIDVQAADVSIAATANIGNAATVPVLTGTLTGLTAPDEGLAFDASGNTYVSNGGFTGTTVSKFAPGATTPTATLTGLSYPRGIAFDASGNLFVANFGAGTVSKFAPGATTASATLTGLSSPVSLAFDASGNLFVTNFGAGTVSKFAPNATTSSATLTGLNGAYALAFDDNGLLYVSNSSGTTVSRFASGATTPTGTLTGLAGPGGLAFDNSGNLFVANQGGTTVSRFAPGATTPGSILTGLTGPLPLAFDASGNLYAGSYAGATLSRFAPGAITADTTLTGLSKPNALVFDGGGNLFVTNQGGTTVSRFVIVTSATTAVTIRQSVNGRAIDLGTNTGSQVGLTDAELDRVSAATLFIGDANSGTITLTAVISPAGYLTLDIQKAAALAATGGFASDVTSAAVYERMKAAGAVTLNSSSSLNVAATGGFVPAAGDSFTILDNTSAGTTAGTFTGMPEGTLITIGGVNKRLTYSGGTGNDIVLAPTTAAGYAAWAAANIPAGQDATFAGDGNRDGILNGVQYVFGTTRLTIPGRGRVPLPPSIPADVDVYLDRSPTLGAASWTPVASWITGAAPVFAGGVSIVSNEVRDTIIVPKVFYRYRVVKR